MNETKTLITDIVTSLSPESWVVTSCLYVIMPSFLLYLSTVMWDAKCTRTRDAGSVLPLPDGTMGFPFVGEMFNFLIMKESFQRSRLTKYGTIYRTHIFGRPTIVVAGSEYVRKILLGEGSIVQTYWPSTTRRILGTNGIVNGDADTHTYIKRLALRAFSPRFMHNYAPIIQNQITTHLKRWRDLSEVEILWECKQMVSRIMMSILLGIHPGDPDLQVYIGAADDIINSILTLPVDLPGFQFHKGLQAKKLIFEKLEKKLRAKFNQTKEELLQDKSPGDKSPSEVDSVLVTILKLARQEEGCDDKLTLINLQNVSLEFIFAGTQSLQCACSLMVVHLCRNPQVVDAVRNEIKRHGLWESPLGEIGHENFGKLRYLAAVVDETMRVTPTIPGGIRVALKTFELGGYQVPKGWQVMYSIRLTHEHESGRVLQDGPECQFDPDQYFHCPCRSGKRPKCRDRKCAGNASPYAYVPFGRGARMCAGKNYGLLFLRILLFELVRTCDVRLSTPLRIVGAPMTKPHKSVRVSVTEKKF